IDDNLTTIRAALHNVAIALTDRTQLQHSLTNRTGGGLAAGDVVGLDPANDSSVTLADAVSTTQPVLIAAATIGSAAAGVFYSSGVMPVKVTGAVVRGNFLRKSATTLALEDSGVAIGTPPPAGTVGVALTDDTAGMATLLKFPSSPGSAGGGSGTQPIFECLPTGATFPTANFAQLVKNVGTHQIDYTLDFDPTTSESASWMFALPSTAVFTAASIRIWSRQPAATAGTVGWLITTLSRAANEAWDTAGVTDTATAAAVPGTAGHTQLITKALTITGWAAGEFLLVKIARDVANDNCAEDVKFMGAVLELS